MNPDEAPPFLGRWPRVYVAVLAYLVLLVTLFWLFTRAFNVSGSAAASQAASCQPFWAGCEPAAGHGPAPQT